MTDVKSYYELNLPISEFLNNDFELTDFSDKDSNITTVKIFSARNVFKNEIIDFFDRLNFKFPYVQIFCSKPGDETSVHMDGVYDSEGKATGTPSFSINWVINGKDSEMSWYLPNSEEAKTIAPKRKKAFAIYENENNLSLIEKTTIINPTLVRIDIPHKVKNFGNQIRWAVSLRFPYNHDSWENIICRLDHIIKK
jgi:hypothetical protein